MWKKLERQMADVWDAIECLQGGGSERLTDRLMVKMLNVTICVTRSRGWAQGRELATARLGEVRPAEWELMRTMRSERGHLEGDGAAKDMHDLVGDLGVDEDLVVDRGLVGGGADDRAHGQPGPCCRIQRHVRLTRGPVAT